MGTDRSRQEPTGAEKHRQTETDDDHTAEERPMNIDKFMTTFDQTILSIPDDPDLVSLYEKAMTAAGFDFADSEQFMEEYVLPEMEQLHQEFLENDQAALSIYRKAGMTDLQAKWRNFRAARLSVLQKRKIKKITEMQIRLGDAQLSLGLMREVILRHRPELKEKYRDLRLLTLEGV